MMKKFVYLLLPFVFPPLLQAKEAPQAEVCTGERSAEKEVNLYIKEMTCQLCVYLVNKELRALEGVISTKADMKARQVKIIAKENVPIERMIKAVEKLNYSAEPI